MSSNPKRPIFVDITLAVTCDRLQSVDVYSSQASSFFAPTVPATWISTVLSSDYEDYDDCYYYGEIESDTKSMSFDLLHAAFVVTNALTTTTIDQTTITSLTVRVSESKSGFDFDNCGWSDIPCLTLYHAHENAGSGANTIHIPQTTDDTTYEKETNQVTFTESSSTFNIESSISINKAVATVTQDSSSVPIIHINEPTVSLTKIDFILATESLVSTVISAQALSLSLSLSLSLRSLSSLKIF